MTFKFAALTSILAALLSFNICPAEEMPLAGEWRFALDRGDVGIGQKWFARELPDRIQLPGILQSQGYGDDIATNTPWVASLGDAWWKLQPAELRDRFSQPGRVEVPFLSQPPKHYLGAAWYQRAIQIPARLDHKRFVLFLERVHWKSTVWLDGREIGSDLSLGTPHEYDFGIVPAGAHRLTIRVDNRTQLPVAGHLVDSHSISDALGATWNGIVGKIELRSTELVWLDDVQVFTNPTNNYVQAVARIGNLTGKAGEGSLFIVDHWPSKGGLSVIGVGCKWGPNGGLATNTFINLSSPWDEFNPALTKRYLLLSYLNKKSSGPAESLSDARPFSYGMRQITTREKDILINGRPANLRMTHFGGDFPLTGYPATDVQTWRRIIQTCKDYGLNGMRLHSWCPPEEAFEAADELGFYLQPECGLWGDFSNPETRQFLEAETARILKAYGNHPSFVLLSPSNEPRNYSHYLPQWAASNYAKDNRRLYSAASGWSDPSQLNGPQYAVMPHFGDSSLRGGSGWFGNDFQDALVDVHIPVLSHEIGQWCAYPDFDVIKKFTGYLRPGNYDIFRYIAQENGILDEDKAFALASGKFQLACYKEEIEANLRTPGLAGFHLLDLHDYLGQGTALIGVLDAFWESKGYASPQDFRKFCGPIVPLAWLHKRVFTTDEKLQADIGLANFGNQTLSNASVRWEVRDARGQVVAFSPSSLSSDVLIGFKGKREHFSLDLSQLPAPAAYQLVAKVNALENGWNFWLYPARAENSKTADVLVTRDWREADANLARGKKVLFLPAATDLDPAKCPPMKNVPVFWNIQMTVRPPQNTRPRFDAFLGLLCETNHPALAEFPTDVNCDWQWAAIINNVRAINLTTAPRQLKPIVWAIDDWNRNWKLGVIFECNVGAGKLMVSALNVNDESGSAELKQLLRSLLDYMGSGQFNPPVTLTREQALALWSRGNSNVSEPTRVFDPDLNDGIVPASSNKHAH